MKILQTTEQVDARIDEMAQEIIDRYSATKPLFICLLKGAVPFTAKLMDAITRHSPDFYPEVEYMHVSAYGEDREAGTAQVYSGVETAKIAGRDIMVLDDCLDQGITYTRTKQYLLDSGAISVQLIVLADKAVERTDVETPTLTGFNTPDVWLVGMGMDDANTAPEAERWAGYIGDVSV